MAKKLPLITDFNNIPEAALVPEDEQPYKIPDHWKWVRLGTIANFIGGGTPDKAVSDFWNGEIPWASVKDLRAPSITTTQDTISQLGLDGSSAQLCEPENLILATRITPGKSTIAKRAIAINQDLKIVKTQLLLPKFLQLYLDSQSIWFEANSSGSTVMGIRISTLNKLATPLPPLKEQQRIVEYVEETNTKIDDVIERLDDVLDSQKALLENTVSAALHGRFLSRESESVYSPEMPSKALIPEDEQPYAIPEHWKWVRLGSVVEVNPAKKKHAHLAADLEVSFIPMAAVSDENGSVIGMETRSLRSVIKGYTNFQEDDVLFAKITPCMENGKAATVPALRNGIGYGSTEFYVLRPSTAVKSAIIHSWVRQRSFRSEAEYNMTGAVGQQRVPKTFIETAPFPLPPLEEQNQIVECIERTKAKIYDTIRVVADTKTRLETLRAQIISAALRGQKANSD